MHGGGRVGLVLDPSPVPLHTIRFQMVARPLLEAVVMEPNLLFLGTRRKVWVEAATGSSWGNSAVCVCGGGQLKRRMVWVCQVGIAAGYGL